MTHNDRHSLSMARISLPPLQSPFTALYLTLSQISECPGMTDFTVVRQMICNTFRSEIDLNNSESVV